MNKHIKVKSEQTDVTRRGFMVGAATGAGLMLGYAVLPNIGASIGEAQAAGTFSPNFWVTLDADGIATVHIVKAEMGQHVGTAMAQALAEELEVPWENVRIDYPDTAPQWGLFVTGGSWSINWTFDQMSRAGAAGRIALMEAAVKVWGVALSDLRAENGVVYHDKSKRKASYGELVAAGVTPRNFSADELKSIKLKPASARKLVGKSVPALDIPEKTRGAAGYGIDVVIEGMVVGTPVVPPVRYGATVKSVDDSAAKDVPGYVKSVIINDPIKTTTGWVVAVADTYANAQKAAKALKIDYDLGPTAKASSDSIMARAKELAADPKSGLLFVSDGDAAGAISGAKTTVEAAYTTGLNIHAPLEPMNATAELKDDVWHLYCGNQFQTLALGVLPVALGVEKDQVVVHQQYLGGGFGRRLEADYLIVAALTAKDVGKPAKVIYSREVDTQMDFTRTITYQTMKAGVDGNGKIVGIEHDVVSAWATARQAPAFLSDSVDKKGKLDAFSVNGSDFWYTVPNHRVRAIMNDQAQAATPSGQLRSVAPGWTAWAVESMLDEVAAKTGQDPVKLRMSMLDGAGKNAGSGVTAGGAKRLANVLKIATEKAGYGKKMPKNKGIGVSTVPSQERPTATWTACVAEVTVNPDSGEFTVDKLTIAMDVGTAVNPDGVVAQIEGSVLWGTSLATQEQASLKDGAIEQDNFDTYTPLRMADMPELDVVVVSPGSYPTGCGEPGVTAVAPAIANAIHNAVGARVRALPITAEAVKAAMKA